MTLAAPAPSAGEALFLYTDSHHLSSFMLQNSLVNLRKGSWFGFGQCPHERGTKSRFGGQGAVVAAEGPRGPCGEASIWGNLSKRRVQVSSSSMLLLPSCCLQPSVSTNTTFISRYGQ